MNIRLIGAVIATLVLGGTAAAQSLDGDWSVRVEAQPDPIDAVVHLTKDAKGGYSGSVDVPAQGISAQPSETVSLDGQSLRLTFAGIDGSFAGHWDAAKAGWVGLWTQNGEDVPMTMTHLAPAANTPSKSADPAQPALPAPAPRS